MGHGDVATLLESWLGGEHVKWQATTEVVAWAMDYGSDLERAWTECPRADHLVAIAGACKAPEEGLVRVVAACAREALQLVPRSEARSTKAVRYAESYRRGRPYDQDAARKIPDDAMAALGDLNARMSAANRAQDAMIQRVRPAWARITDAAMKQVLEVAARGDIDAEATRRAMVESACEALLEATATDKDMRLFRPRQEEMKRIYAFGHAARAAASAATVAASADIAANTLVLLGRLRRAGPGPQVAADAFKAAAIAARSGARIYTEGALVFRHAADAFGQAAGLGDRAWESSIRAFFAVLAEATLAGGELAAAAPTEAMDATLEVFIEEAKLAKLAHYADALRAAIPFSALSMERAAEGMGPEIAN
jgi:hypothetical protein